MSETPLAHYNHGHEAEFARGFLDDAGIPVMVVSDDAAGGSPYLGGLAGATVWVASVDLERAREVLRSAGVLTAATALGDHGPIAVPALDRAALPPALAADLDDVTRDLARARRREFRHLLWAMLGVSPAALIPIIGLAREGEVALLALLCVAVVFAEGWRWIRAGKEVKRLEGVLAELEGAAKKGGG